MFSLEEFKECGWELKNVTYDLHSTDLPNVKTEYEEKFSEKGQPIFRLEAIQNSAHIITWISLLQWNSRSTSARRDRKNVRSSKIKPI